MIVLVVILAAFVVYGIYIWRLANDIFNGSEEDI